MEYIIHIKDVQKASRRLIEDLIEEMTKDGVIIDTNYGKVINGGSPDYCIIENYYKATR